MTEQVKEHWIENDSTRAKFWAYAKGELGLIEDEAHEALKVESVKDYKGTKEEALSALKKFAADKSAQITAEQRAQRAQERAATDALLQDAVASFPSLPVWASTVAVDPSGFPWKVSIAAGLKPVLRMAAVEQVQEGVAEFAEWAACHGWTPGNGYRAAPPPQVTINKTFVREQAPQPQAPSGGPPEPPAPPPPPTSAGAPPAAAEQAQGGDGNGMYFDTEYIKIGLTKSNNPCIQFWNPDREYPEIVWYFSGDKLLAKAPWLDARGITEQMLQTVSVGDAKIDVPCRVYYALSDKKSARGTPYKDIMEIKPL